VGCLAGLGVKVAASTVWEILKASGINPARRRTWPTWSQFLHSQADAILASDFFTVDLLDGTQAYVLAVIEHATRRIRVLGITLHPPESGPPSRPATSSWSSATRLIGSSS
jgi:putative transposase